MKGANTYYKQFKSSTVSLKGRGLCLKPGSTHIGLSAIVSGNETGSLVIVLNLDPLRHCPQRFYAHVHSNRTQYQSHFLATPVKISIANTSNTVSCAHNTSLFSST
ncbi:hypothetical protein EYC80_007405 [Monilinia laxa]|uniref:Uncharacterized protein n=1 Tax=Monilinia laxa TaxID=61186 RepID=A0A5N6JVL5_MONLA|nr:hypothetical protein EYC80_007405 [Monilinia laxa]